MFFKSNITESVFFRLEMQQRRYKEKIIPSTIVHFLISIIRILQLKRRKKNVLGYLSI